MNYTVQYDSLVLAAIFATMAIGVDVGFLTPVAVPAVVTAAGLVATVVIAHGLFLNGLVDAPDDSPTKCMW